MADRYFSLFRCACGENAGAVDAHETFIARSRRGFRRDVELDLLAAVGPRQDAAAVRSVDDAGDGGGDARLGRRPVEIARAQIDARRPVAEIPRFHLGASERGLAVRNRRADAVGVAEEIHHEGGIGIAADCFRRAFLHDLSLVEDDNPVGALDANVRRDLRRWLREIHEELGITTLFVTHDQEEALDLADRVVILDQGKIVQEGTPEAVCRNPNSAFVMNFLGDANRISATVVNGKAALGGAEVEAENFGDGPASVYLRPRDLDWSATEPGIAATVARVIDRPDGRRILARTAAGEQIELDVAPETAARAGDQGFVRIHRARVFAASTSK